MYKYLHNSTDMSSIALTENNDLAYSTTGSKCLDFFTRIVRNANIDDTITSYREAFIESQEIALQILFNLRDIRDGKGERHLVTAILIFLRFTLPLDVQKILFEKIIAYGYYKDLLKVEEVYCRLTSRQEPLIIDILSQQLQSDMKIVDNYENPKESKEDFTLVDIDQEEIKTSNIISKKKSVAISLAAKWLPNESSHFDQKPMQISERIIKSIFKDKPRLYRKALTKLRQHLNLLETFMSNQQFQLIDFSKLPAMAIRKTRTAFLRDTNSEGKQSEGRKLLKLSYEAYLKKLAEGKTKVNVKGTQPHQLVNHYLNGGQFDQLIESQWNELIKRVTEAGVFRKCTAVVDVSSSMNGEPLQAAIALGILVAECTEKPFKSKIITFSSNPEWHIAKGNTLEEKVNCVRSANWGGSTNLNLTFEMLLKDYEIYNIPPEGCADTLFIFTDMQYNQVNPGFMDQKEGKTTFQLCKEKFEKANRKFPKIVCWNLRTSDTKTVPTDQKDSDIVLLSGFSSELLKCILTGKEFNPLSMMKHVLSPYEIPDELIKCKPDFSKSPNIEELKKALDDSVPKKHFKKSESGMMIRGRGRGRGRGRR